MALKKPTDLFKKANTAGVFNNSGNSFDINESYDKFRSNFEKVNELSERIELLSEEITQKLTKNDLENAMLSQLMILDQNFKNIQEEIKGLNKQDLKKFKETASDLNRIVENLVNVELPKYRNKITKNEIYFGEKVDQINNTVNQNINIIREDIDDKFDKIATVVDNNINYFNQQLQETSSKVKKTTETYNSISKILENRIETEDSKLEEYSAIIETLQKSFYDLKKTIFEETNSSIEKLTNTITYNTEKISSELNNKILDVHNVVEEKIDSVFEKVNNVEDKVSSEISSIKAEVVIFEKHNKDTKNDLKTVEKYIQEHYKDLEELKEQVYSEIQSLQIGNIQDNIQRLDEKIEFIRETYSKIQPEVLVKEVISEGLLNEPPDTKNSDTLTPLNQNFVTLEQLQEHYRLFINRIQQQLSTIGGGGETRLKYLDDIVGIATNPSAYNGKFLKYNHSIGKFEFATVSGGGGGSQSLDDVLSIGNVSSYGIDVGTSTFNNKVTVGGATTALIVDGNARILGILTVGSSSITFDGVNNTVSIGTVRIADSSGNANYTGVVTATSFSGSGSSLTGIVTQIVAGSNITISPGNGKGVVTINSSANTNYASTAGIATYASTAGVSTALQNSRTFQITGDVVATAISFDGTGNVSLAATIQPNSVALGTDTTGDYVQSISGTSNQITISSGTGESSTPVVAITTNPTLPGNVTVENDLIVDTNTLVVKSATDRVGIGTTNPLSKLYVSGDTYVTGVVTATTFVGALTGTATTATKLQNSRTFEITGDVVATAISFDGTGNVSLAATIQPNSVALGTDTTGDYVQSLSGTSNQITVTSGSGEGSTPTLSIPNQFTLPQDATVTRDLQVNRNLNVTGNITIGGTSATLFTTELKVADPDLVLGIRTDGSGNDVSTDSTANHGGIAIASTEGNPLVQLYIAGIETTPATYKKIMWFKSGTFSGLGTDAWLSNYAIGIGSTQVPNGVRLSVGGVQITENDVKTVRNINSTGIITASSGFVGALTGTATTATKLENSRNFSITGDFITATSISFDGTGNVALAATITQDSIVLGTYTTGNYVKSISNGSYITGADGGSESAVLTIGVAATSANTVNQIVARDSSGNFIASTITANLTGTATTATKLQNSRTFEITGDVVASAISFDGTGNVSLAATIQPNSVALGTDTTGDYVQSISGTSNQITVTSGTGEGSTPVVAITTNPTLPGNVTVQNDLIVDTNTLVVNSTTDRVGIGTTNPTSKLYVSGDTFVTGVVTATTFVGALTGTATTATNLSDAANITTGTINSARLSGSYSINITGSSGYATTAGIATLSQGLSGTPNINVGILTATSGNFSGIVTSSGANISGATTATSFVRSGGTSSQFLKADGSVDSSSYLTTTGSGVNLTGIVTSIVAGTNVTISGSTGQVTINASGGGGSSSQWVTTDVGIHTLSNVGIGTTNPNASVGVANTAVLAVGIVTAYKYYGDGSSLTGITASGSGVVVRDDGVLVGTATTIDFGTNLSVSFSSGIATVTASGGGGTSSQWVTTDVGIHTLSNVGIGTTNPTSKLYVSGDTFVTGVVTATSFVRSGGTSSQFLKADGSVDSSSYLTTTGSGVNLTGIVTSIVAGTNVTISGSTGQVTINASGGGGGSGKFDTNIDNVLYIQPTGTLDIVGIGTTTTQITTLPSGSNEYLIHSIHVTNISNGDVEITAAFDINNDRVLSSYSSGGGSGIHTCVVSSASSISIGMGVTGTNIDFNTLVTDKSGNMIVFSKPLTGTPSGTLTFIPVSKVVSRLPVPVGSSVELLKQPFILGGNDSIRVQSTGIGTAGVTTTTATASSGAAALTVASATNIASGQLVSGVGISTNTYVGVGYTPSSTIVPITKATTSALSSTLISFSDLIVPQDGALQTTIVYQSSTDTSYQNGTSKGVGVGTIPAVYYGTGNTYPAVIQSIRVANISDSGDYPVWVGIGNSDTVFAWLSYNMIIPKNSSIEICEAPKRLGIGQSIYAYSDTLNAIEIQIAAKQKTS